MGNSQEEVFSVGLEVSSEAALIGLGLRIAQNMFCFLDGSNYNLVVIILW